MAGLIVGIVSLRVNEKVASDLLQSIATHVAVLVETNDRPELQRLITSAGAHSNSVMDVVVNGVVVASSRARESIGLLTYENPRSRFLPSRSGAYVVTFQDAVRTGGSGERAVIRLFSPLSDVLEVVGLSILAVFAACLLVTWILGAKFIAVAQRSLQPVNELQAAIRNILSNELLTTTSFKIRELEMIRDAVLSTKGQLNAATEKLVEARGREIGADAYRRLIHDLHTPVTALREMMKLSGDKRLSEAQRAEASEKMVLLAEQVLRQVRVGKNNLAVVVQMRPNSDLVETVKTAIERVQLATEGQYNLQIAQNFSAPSIPFDHDPALLERVISNLVINAAEASASVIEVTATTDDGAPVIRVIDDGPGMSPEQVSLHLVGRGKSSKADRAGVGLSSCNHIVRSHGGKVIHRPSKYGGSEFEVRLKWPESEGML